MINDRQKQAAKNLDATITRHRRFPDRVFEGRWCTFLFFDPDLLFEPKFVDRIKVLLSCENSVSACMRNLESNDPNETSEETPMFLDKETTGEFYMTRLRGAGVGSGWLYRMDRYGCASDIGSWCIYCERNNEIAVIALSRPDASSQFKPAIEQFDALPIEQAIERPSSYGLSSRGLPLEWRNRLIQEYAPNRSLISRERRT